MYNTFLKVIPVVTLFLNVITAIPAVSQNSDTIKRSYPKNKVDKVFGFKKVHLESDISEISKHLKIIDGSTEEGLTSYFVSDYSDKKIDGCSIEYVSIYVFNNKVHSILISTNKSEADCISRLLKSFMVNAQIVFQQLTVIHGLEKRQQFYFKYMATKQSLPFQAIP